MNDLQVIRDLIGSYQANEYPIKTILLIQSKNVSSELINNIKADLNELIVSLDNVHSLYSDTPRSCVVNLHFTYIENPNDTDIYAFYSRDGHTNSMKTLAVDKYIDKLRRHSRQDLTYMLLEPYFMVANYQE